MFMERYTIEDFSNLIKTQAYEDITYCVNGFIFVCSYNVFERINSKAIDYRKMIKFQDFAEENNELTMIVFIGDNHTKMMCEYLDAVEEVRQG